MMKEYYFRTDNISQWKEKVNAGDKIFLSGTVYTARDAAHKRIFELIENNQELPFSLCGSTIFYAGPTPAPLGLAVGSCGPTTSSRMDAFAPDLYNKGIACTIGKGPRNQKTVDAIIKNKALYLCAIGGAGALAAHSIKKCDVIAFDDLGCESVKRFEFNNFPLFVAIDSSGNTIFNSQG